MNMQNMLNGNLKHSLDNSWLNIIDGAKQSQALACSRLRLSVATMRSSWTTVWYEVPRA